MENYYNNTICGIMEGLWHSEGHTEREVSEGEMPKFTEELLFPASSTSISWRLITMYWPTQRKVKDRRYFSIFKKSNFYQKTSDLKEEVNIKIRLEEINFKLIVCLLSSGIVRGKMWFLLTIQKQFVLSWQEL